MPHESNSVRKGAHTNDKLITVNRKKQKQRKEKNKLEKIKMKRRNETIKKLEEIQKKFNKIKKKEEKKDLNEDDLTPWGDVLTTTREWPRNEDNQFRIFGQNVNGVSYFNEYIEWEMLLNYMDEFQVDSFCINEVNLDLNKIEVNEGP